MRALLLLLPLAACSVSVGGHHDEHVEPSGAGDTRTFAVRGFDKVDLAGSDDVAVSVGGGYSVTATGPSDELDKLRIEKNGDTLEIGRKHDAMSWGTHRPVTIHVTLPALSGASVSGSADMKVDRVSGGAFAAQAAGSGSLTLASVAADSVNFSIAGSGDITAAGRAKTIDVDIAGSGELKAKALTASQAKVSIAGSGDAAASVDGPATVSILGSGDADLGDKARCTTQKLGSGDAHCGG